MTYTTIKLEKLIEIQQEAARVELERCLKICDEALTMSSVHYQVTACEALAVKRAIQEIRNKIANP